MSVTAVDYHTPIHRISVADFQRMIELGVFSEDDRVELIEGVIVDMVPPGPEHVRAVTWLTKEIATAAGDAFVSVQNPVVLPASASQPQPDISVVTGEALARGLPESALLAIEIAFSSQAFDRNVKTRLYARAGIPEYWLVDLRRDAVEVRRDPAGDTYGTLTIAAPGDVLTPVALPNARIDVAALLRFSNRPA